MLLRILVSCLAIAAASPAWADGDPVAGAIVFKKCELCHTNIQGQNKIGPSLWGIIGRPSASIPDYAYSTAMKNLNKVWTPELLEAYLPGPQKMVPGTKMTFFGLPNEKDRADVIAYLGTLK
jgi:cytochrome c